MHWRPVGPLPAAVYWRRRAVLAAVALLLVVLVVRLWPGGGDDRLTASTSPSGSATPSPSRSASASAPVPASPSPSATPAAACTDGQLQVTATTDAEQYASGAKAVLTLSVKNTGTTPCRRAVGQGAVELVVTSGDDRIWSSDDCAPGGDQGEVVLAPGEGTSARATWPGTRSKAGCPPDQPAAQPGTYRVTARVGDLSVPGQVFQVT